MNEKETAEELRKKAQELLAMADKISPPIQKSGENPKTESGTQALPKGDGLDWARKKAKGLNGLHKSKQLKGS